MDQMFMAIGKSAEWIFSIVILDRLRYYMVMLSTSAKYSEIVLSNLGTKIIMHDETKIWKQNYFYDIYCASKHWTRKTLISSVGHVSQRIIIKD